MLHQNHAIQRRIAIATIIDFNETKIRVDDRDFVYSDASVSICYIRKSSKQYQRIIAELFIRKPTELTVDSMTWPITCTSVVVVPSLADASILAGQRRATIIPILIKKFQNFLNQKLQLC